MMFSTAPKSFTGERSLEVTELAAFRFGGSPREFQLVGYEGRSALCFTVCLRVASVCTFDHCTLPFFLFWRSRLPRDRRTLIKLVILCLLFVGVIAAQVYGLAGQNSCMGVVLVYTQPIFVFCLAVPRARAGRPLLLICPS